MTDMPEIGLDQLRADIAAGTPGPWLKAKNSNRVMKGTSCIAQIFRRWSGSVEVTEIDARRVSRLPNLEAAYLELADLVSAKDAEIARLLAALAQAEAIIRESEKAFPADLRAYRGLRGAISAFLSAVKDAE